MVLPFSVPQHGTLLQLKGLLHILSLIVFAHSYYFFRGKTPQFHLSTADSLTLNTFC